MHTAEHILNGTMVRMFGCTRSRNAHIERKKSKCDYLLDTCACIGAHVKNTAEIGSFKILSHDYENGRWRVRWKVQ